MAASKGNEPEICAKPVKLGDDWHPDSAASPILLGYLAPLISTHTHSRTGSVTFQDWLCTLRSTLGTVLKQI